MMWQIRERKGRKRWRSRGYQQFDRIVGREERKRDERKREVGGMGRDRKETGCRREEKERKERRGEERAVRREERKIGRAHV